jgi:hypothetical protein
MALLVYADTDGVEKSFTVGVEPVTVGRATECSIRSSDPRVSRNHARFYLDPAGTLHVEDLGSSNGVFVGQYKVQVSAVPVNELVLVGSLTFRLVPQTPVQAPAAGGEWSTPATQPSGAAWQQPGGGAPVGGESWRQPLPAAPQGWPQPQPESQQAWQQPPQQPAWQPQSDANAQHGWQQPPPQQGWQQPEPAAPPSWQQPPSVEVSQQAWQQPASVEVTPRASQQPPQEPATPSWQQPSSVEVAPQAWQQEPAPAAPSPAPAAALDTGALDAERKARMAAEEERDAYGARMAELHQEVRALKDQLAQAQQPKPRAQSSPQLSSGSIDLASLDLETIRGRLMDAEDRAKVAEGRARSAEEELEVARADLMKAEDRVVSEIAAHEERSAAELASRVEELEVTRADLIKAEDRILELSRTIAELEAKLSGG